MSSRLPYLFLRLYKRPFLYLIIGYMVLALPHASAAHYVVGAENIDYFPHYNFNNKKNKGFIWTVLEKFAASSGHIFEYRAYPVKRLHQELIDGKIDFIYPDNPEWQSSERDQSAKIFSLPIVTSFGSTMVLPDRKNKGLKNFELVSVPHGFTSVMYASLVELQKVRLIEVPDAIMALQLVLKERVDGADVEYNVAKHLLKQLGREDALVFDPSLPFDPANYHLSTIKHINVISQFDLFMAKNQKHLDGEKKRYGLEEIRLKPQKVDASDNF